MCAYDETWSLEKKIEKERSRGAWMMERAMTEARRTFEVKTAEDNKTIVKKIDEKSFVFE